MKGVLRGLLNNVILTDFEEHLYYVSMFYI